jgi:penicillin V acylase-like amidase (Ntn superfamily)
MCTEFILPQATGYRISGRTMDLLPHLHGNWQQFHWQRLEIY